MLRAASSCLVEAIHPGSRDLAFALHLNHQHIRPIGLLGSLMQHAATQCMGPCPHVMQLPQNVLLMSH